MKKTATLLVLSMAFTAATFTGDIRNNVNQQVLASFQQRFAQAKEIT